MTLTNNLISYWKMNGNSNDSVGSLNGTDVSITYNTSNGIVNQGAGFNGTTSKITTGGPAFGLAGSISFWINPVSFGTVSSGGFVFDSSSANRYLVYFLETTGVRHISWFLNGTIIANPGTTVVNTGSWQHFVLTWDNSLGSNKQAIYKNGVLDSNNNVTITAATPTNLFMGTRFNSTEFYNGALDEVGIWKRALTASEISLLYNSGAGLTYPFTNGDFLAFM